MSIGLYKGDEFRVFPTEEAAQEALTDGWHDNPKDAKTAPKKRGRPRKDSTNENQS